MSENKFLKSMVVQTTTVSTLISTTHYNQGHHVLTNTLLYANATYNNHIKWHQIPQFLPSYYVPTVMYGVVLV